ncbi:ATP-dependent protease [Aggregicoccus sp. 17bor-14]|uniref:LON peptidase substrate-binding domain-containing protein n=1 Tax=Myxococcaceae TaxID=31 RepID=UPI00129CE0D0|nr:MULTISPECIES: LON peptidase substrate-binding domain-containing protein [Myxococcaceae]MBF5046111.1 LON peptidase substrate-binding domain-containing protein [Simulacricoccus sp. 17bor-14]MRI91838.1 ATP-dependent protease [Aggregicoccus sp. 17bor-14]
MTSQERVERAAAVALKVFPLPSAVLFPHSVLPLHIFEPRYRELVRDALAGDGVMALGGLQPGWERDYGGRPPLAPLLCVGTILWHEEVEEGRYNLLLQGVCRGRVLEELPARKLYREVQVQLLPDAAYNGPEEEALRQAVFELAGRVPPSFAENLLPVAARAAGGTLADVVAAALVPETERRLELLEQLDVGARLAALMDDVSELIARLSPVPQSGPLN